MACVGGVYYPHFLCTQRTMRLDAMPSATASPLGVFYPSPGEGRERAPALFSLVFVVMAGGPLTFDCEATESRRRIRTEPLRNPVQLTMKVKRM